MGELCYKDKDRFPNGAWCKEGQFVIYGRYAGARFKTKYGEHRILNDDEIIGTVTINKKTNTLVFLNCTLKSKKKIISTASGVWKILNYKIPGAGFGG